MLDIDKAALLAVVGGWVVKKSSSSAPQRLTEEDCALLAGAARSTWQAMQFVSDEGGLAKNPLQEFTRDWIVQRTRGAVPGHLMEADFHVIMESLGFAQREVEPQQVVPESEPIVPVSSQSGAAQEWRQDFMPADALQENEMLPDGRRVRDVLQEDPLYFARLHLALSL